MRERLWAITRRVRRFERREVHELRHWLERTSNLVHLSILLVVPLLMILVTSLSNAVGGLSFLLYPPLASGAYTLFANPEGKYASPVRFVGGLTVGAACGWIAVEFAVSLLYTTPPGQIHSAGAALAILLTGLVTWGLGVEEPAAYSTALLTLFVHGQIETPEYFVLSIAVSSAIVAGTFAGWRRWVYERRAQYLYESTSGDDHVLVPMRGPNPGATAMLAARIAGAHRAGKVVLLDIVDEEWMARAERALLEDHGDARLLNSGPSSEGEPITEPDPAHPDDIAAHESVSESVADLETRANAIETQVGVPCQVVVATSGTDPATATLRTSRQANCDLVVSPYESRHGAVSPFIRELFRGDIDVLVHHSHGGRTRWKQILVSVRGVSDVATSMLDFATRLARKTGEVSVGTCIANERERRRAEEMLANLVETFEGHIETRVSRSEVERFLGRHGNEYDIVVIGASQDRSAASRFISPPTFERIDGDEVGTDVAIVDRH